MVTILKIVSATTWIFIVSLFLVVFYQILTGKIDVKGLLLNGDGLSVNRIQLLIITTIGALYYFLQVMADPTKFPDVPEGLLYVVGGSGLIYLAGQYRSMTRIK
jgi:hypothetical protein